MKRFLLSVFALTGLVVLADGCASSCCASKSAKCCQPGATARVGLALADSGSHDLGWTLPRVGDQP